MLKSPVGEMRANEVREGFRQAVEKIGLVSEALAILNAHPAFMSMNRAVMYRWLEEPIKTQARIRRVLFATRLLTGEVLPEQVEVDRLQTLKILHRHLNRLQRIARLLDTNVEAAIKAAGKLAVAAIMLCLAATVHADAVTFATGEQIAMVQGTIAEGALSFGRLKLVPWVLLDGSKFEAMPMWQFGGTPDSLVVGPLIGMGYDATGTTPYFGGEIRGKIKLGPGTLVFRVAERHTREKMLNRFANLGLEAGPKPFRVRLSYQPLTRNKTTVQRLAVKATVPYRGAKIGLEVRSSLDERQRKGAMLDLVVPLK